MNNFKGIKKWIITGIILFSIIPMIFLIVCCKNYYKVHNYQKKIEKINNTRVNKENTNNSTFIIE